MQHPGASITEEPLPPQAYRGGSSCRNLGRAAVAGGEDHWAGAMLERGNRPSENLQGGSQGINYLDFTPTSSDHCASHWPIQAESSGGEIPTRWPASLLEHRAGREGWRVDLERGTRKTCKHRVPYALFDLSVALQTPPGPHQN